MNIKKVIILLILIGVALFIVYSGLLTKATVSLFFLILGCLLVVAVLTGNPIGRLRWWVSGILGIAFVYIGFLTS